MTLAQDMGIEELKTACEDYVVSTLSVTNACGYLASVMDLQDKPSSKFFCFFALNYHFQFYRSFARSFGCWLFSYVAMVAIS